MNVNFEFRLWQHEVTTSYDLTESIGICGDSFAFWGRCSDWILTVQWPWAVLAVSTKQYVHTYHQTRHKSLSPQWTLNQVLVSGWEQRAAANRRGQKGRPGSPHNCRCQENHQVGKCKQKLQKVFIKLPSGDFWPANSSGTHVGGSRYRRHMNFIPVLNTDCGLHFLCSTIDMVTRTDSKLLRTRQLIKKSVKYKSQCYDGVWDIACDMISLKIKPSFDSISYFYSN